jgi:hypothetical protein
MEKTYKETAVHERARDEVEVAEHKEAQRMFYHRFRPFFKLSYKTRIIIGVLALVGAVLGSAYGFSL